MSAGANYIDLLCQNNLVAKALLMHYGVLLARTEGIWWARLAGEKIVNDMAQVLKGSWDGSVKMVEWCRSNMRR
ncbi:hypothetical protein T440DRAFT_390061 [Plenodomus tracheiphilus IPT5]|uniref:Uncharacterized protein n=1 Tax=Plenodomus tracheiphilus IPT5 TaxID=1408161 RepID=A0A6A7BFU5_9PLEO|nr:hypothetical protein T440DRAFT_390061 [Plenodomus tracheiphilus IPT5]